MMYTRVKIKKVSAEKASPSYVKDSPHGKILQTKSLYRAEYPEHTRIISDTAQPACMGSGTTARELGYIFDTRETENTDSDRETEHESSFGRVICAVFSVFLGAAMIYFSGVSAPEYVDRFFMSAYNTVTEKYAEVFAAGSFSAESFTGAENNESSAVEVTDERTEIPDDVNTTFPADFGASTENSYIASLAVGGAASDNSLQTQSASVNEEMPAPQGTAVTVSKNLSPGSDKIYISNETHLVPDLDSLALAQYPISVNADEQDLPRVLIVHTHGTEGYSDSTPDGTARTTDKNKNVVRVGRELAQLLNMYGIPTLHSETMHDEISYITSYNSSKKEVQKLLSLHPSIKYVIDVHRDAIPNDGNSRVKPIAEIGGEGTAQLMLVVGTNAGGGDHPGYIRNLTVAAHLQKQMNDTYPGLARPVNIRSAIFNQNVCSGAFLLEVGSDANTLNEALAAVRLFARCFAATEFQQSR